MDFRLHQSSAPLHLVARERDWSSPFPVKRALHQKVGVGLIIVSFVAAIALQIVTGDLVHVTTIAEPPVKGPIISTQAIVHIAAPTWLLLLLVGGAAGVFLMLLPRHSKPGA